MRGSPDQTMHSGDAIFSPARGVDETLPQPCLLLFKTSSPAEPRSATHRRRGSNISAAPARGVRRGKFIKSGADYLHYYAHRIAELIGGCSGRKVVIEIGGGFGGMAYYLMRGSNDAVYIDFDLPENLALTSYYLLKALPDKKILLYGEADLSEASLLEYDAILMPSFELDTLPDNVCDLVFNSYSLAEMSAETIRHYVHRAAGLTRPRGWFFHVNHTKDSVVSARDFPLPKNFTLVNEVFAAWNLGRNQNMDEYEFLYQKSDGPPHGE